MQADRSDLVVKARWHGVVETDGAAEPCAAVVGSVEKADPVWRKTTAGHDDINAASAVIAGDDKARATGADDKAHTTVRVAAFWFGGGQVA